MGITFEVFFGPRRFFGQKIKTFEEIPKSDDIRDYSSKVKKSPASGEAGQYAFYTTQR